MKMVRRSIWLGWNDNIYRIYSLIDELKMEYNDKNILLISHGGVCRVINTYFRDMTNEEFFQYRLENGKLEEYEL